MKCITCRSVIETQAERYLKILSGNISFIFESYIPTNLMTEILPTAGAHDAHNFSVSCSYRDVQKKRKIIISIRTK